MLSIPIDGAFDPDNPPNRTKLQVRRRKNANAREELARDESRKHSPFEFGPRFVESSFFSRGAQFSARRQRVQRGDTFARPTLGEKVNTNRNPRVIDSTF